MIEKLYDIAGQEIRYNILDYETLKAIFAIKWDAIQNFRSGETSQYYKNDAVYIINEIKDIIRGNN